MEEQGSWAVIEPAPAFPQCAQVGNLEDWKHGMTLRDWFAGLAMQGLLSANDGDNIKRVAVTFGISEGQAVCRIAYDTADHMIEEREKEK